MSDINSRNEKLAALVAEYSTLDKERDDTRIRAIFEEVAGLVDRETEPKKWAAFRCMFAQFSESTNPRAAIQAYSDALTVWDYHDDHDSWASCHMSIGTLMAQLSPLMPEDIEEAITHLEYTVSDFDFLASSLAVLYQNRKAGDPYENWQKRIRYLMMDIEQTSHENDQNELSQKYNQLALAKMDEPNADFNKLLEQRIFDHKEVLNLSNVNDKIIQIETNIYLSECYTFRIKEDIKLNHSKAEQYAQIALGVSSDISDSNLRIKALLNSIRVALASPFSPTLGDMNEQLNKLNEVDRLIDFKISPELKATVESFYVNTYLNLINLNEPIKYNVFISHVESALSYSDSNLQHSERKSILQVAGEGLIGLEKFEEASLYLKRAIEYADEALVNATTYSGRMQRIWDFRNSCALLSYCNLRLGKISEAILDLDRGKTRLWPDLINNFISADLHGLIPLDGALLICNFAAKEGAVIIVTTARIDVIWLPDFGKGKLLEFLVGNSELLDFLKGGIDFEENNNKSHLIEGWLGAYYNRADSTRTLNIFSKLQDKLINQNNDELEKKYNDYKTAQEEAQDIWFNTIDNIGHKLYEEFWEPVLAKLKELGIETGAELVVFPQGGSSVFPWHAAWVEHNNIRRWLLDDYAIRYAPSIRSLLNSRHQKETNQTALWVINPTGDLEYIELECAWAKNRLPSMSHEFLHKNEATPEAILEALPRANIAHFSCHAQFSLDNPLLSSFGLAKEKSLTIEKILPILADHSPELVVLSACETGISRVTITPDEFLGFPAAWLHAGTDTVLATLWPVDALPSAVLVGQFYKYIFEEKMTPAQALRHAQNFTRKATVGQLRSLLKELTVESSPIKSLAANVRNKLFELDQNQHIYESPFFWSGFVLFGRK